MRALSEIGERLETTQADIAREAEIILGHLAGKSLRTLEANQSLIRLVHRLLLGLNMRLKCPRCGQPAYLRCSRRAGRPTGGFAFDHTLPSGRRTHHLNSAVFPEIKGLLRPRRRRQKPGSE